jgi:hypothetical protein
MIDPTYADRLRETIARKIKLRGVFTSQGLIEDNEREIRKAQDALRWITEDVFALAADQLAEFRAHKARFAG